ncbi:MAG TPA: ArsA family ATPase [Terriglobales bacterium]|nr:ArsA family ATPase [Terriglobales bacterium]
MHGHGRLILVTGKGGVGKTTLAAGFGLHSATTGRRTLIVETASDSRLLPILGVKENGASTIREIEPQLHAVRISARQLVEDYFASLLRFSFLSKRLFESSSFNALTAAAPGISEFLLLERVLEWLAPDKRQRPYDVVILDGPATGHALKLLRTPRNLLGMVPAGPLAGSAQRMNRLLEDPERTLTLIVAIPEELSVQETIETHRALRENIGVAVSRPVINRMFPQAFSKAEVAQVQLADERDAAIAAARFAIARRQEAERNAGRLRRALGVSPLQLPQVFTDRLDRDTLLGFGQRVGDDILGLA